MLLAWIKKLHLYVGLVNLTLLVVFGLVGLAASFHLGGGGRHGDGPQVSYVDYRAPADLSDRAVADDAYRAVDLPLTRRPAARAIRRDRHHDLRFRLSSPTSEYEVVVLEAEGRLRIEARRVDAWRYLTRLHRTTLARAGADGDWRLRLWAGYVEASIFSLLLMATSGVLLWLGSRPRLRWAWASLAAGVLAFVVLWLLSR